MGCLCAILRFIFLLDGGGERVTWHMWEPSPAHLEEGREGCDCPKCKVANSTLADGTGPADIPADGFYQKYKIPMFILFSALAILIFGSTIWQCCFRKKKSIELESQFHLPPFIGHGGVSREDNHLPYPHSFHYHQYGGRTRASTRNRDRGRDRHGREVIRTTSGWWRHAGLDRPLYRNRPQRQTRVGIRVPPTTGTPLDGAYSMAYMQEETRQEQPQQHREGRQHEEYEMDAHKGQARETTPPPPYKARRSTDDTVDRPPGCLCAHV
ncbi:hypothetical protein B0H65DRAFT_507837 [Neurospora tetraspora]|uniref:Uncharacterized protein n=1 Tax=Neurospora tetraspora TaxID=94610 RepID=A0AAE0JHN2_9PEZI|nr:hypothetical protein B0H65DRAFT_507837 [Neurospora tetraspora]